MDEFTGRLMEGRRFSDGLHQAIEAIENVHVREESQTLASVTFQNYFRMFPKLAGMTGTAVTEAEEFINIFMDQLHQCIKTRAEISVEGVPENQLEKLQVKSVNSWSNFFKNDYSYIIHNFHSQLLGLTNCPKCNYCTSSHDPIQVISLEISNYSKSLYDCFQQYTKKIVIHKKCA